MPWQCVFFFLFIQLQFAGARYCCCCRHYLYINFDCFSEKFAFCLFSTVTLSHRGELELKLELELVQNRFFNIVAIVYVRFFKTLNLCSLNLLCWIGQSYFLACHSFSFAFCDWPVILWLGKNVRFVLFFLTDA